MKQTVQMAHGQETGSGVFLGTPCLQTNATLYLHAPINFAYVCHNMKIFFTPDGRLQVRAYSRGLGSQATHLVRLPTPL